MLKSTSAFLPLLKPILFLFILFSLNMTLQRLLPLEFIAINIEYLISSILSSIAISYLYDKRVSPIFCTVDKFSIRNSMITIALVVIMIALIFVLKSLIFDLSINHNFQVIDAVTFITSMLCISIYEELSFRGIIFEWLTEKLGINLSILLSSIIFSLFHITNNGFDFLSFLNVFLAGVFLSFLIFKSGSIIPSILFHFLWNISLPTFVDSSVSGFMYSNLIEFDSSSDIYFQLFFGDKFGIESGLVVTLLLILGIIVIAKYIKLSPYSEAVRLKKLYNTYN